MKFFIKEFCCKCDKIQCFMQCIRFRTLLFHGYVLRIKKVTKHRKTKH